MSSRKVVTIDPRVCAKPLPRAFPSRRGRPSSNADTVAPRSSRPMAMLLLPTSPPPLPPPSSPPSSPSSLSSYCRRLWSSWSLPPLRLTSPPDYSFCLSSRFVCPLCGRHLPTPFSVYLVLPNLTRGGKGLETKQASSGGHVMWCHFLSRGVCSVAAA